MEQSILCILLKVIYAILATIFLGNGTVVIFNRIPLSWFINPDENNLNDSLKIELKMLSDKYGIRQQRIKSTPWKYIFMAYFGTIGMYFALNKTFAFEVAALTILFILLLISISDIKYMTVPNQFTLMILLSSVGFIPVHYEWKDIFYGAIGGCLIAIIIYILGRVIYGNKTIRQTYIEIYLSLGIALGLDGVVFVFIVATFTMIIEIFYKTVIEKRSIKEKRPLSPHIFIAVTIWLVFFSKFLKDISLLT